MENYTNATNLTRISAFLHKNDSVVFYNFVAGLYVYAIPLISVIGVIGNVWSFKVFVFTSFNKHPSSIYLAMLGVSDTCFLIALIFGWIGTIHDSTVNTGVLCLVSVYIAYVSSFLSVWYVVLIMVDRFIVVCFPLRGYRLCSKRRSLIAGTVVTVFGILFYSHSFFTVQVVPTPGGVSCQLNNDYRHLVTVITYIDTGITFVFPFVAIFVLNIVVIVTIRKFSFKHVTLRGNKYYSPPHNILSNAQMRLTVMLIVVAIVFLVLNLPSHGIRFYILVKDLAQTKDLVLFLSQQICQILYYINFSVNFTLYVSSSKTFRRCLFEKARCLRH